MAEKIPIIYLCIHERLKERFQKRETHVKNVFEIFGKTYGIKKIFWYPVLKELQNYSLIERINKSVIVVLGNRIDLKNTSKVYKAVGLY